MFQLKDFTSIVAGMINHMRGTQTKVTDFNIGSAARTMVEAPAVEIDALYQQMWNGLKEAIPVATFNSFDFTPLPAIPANGLFLVTIGIQATDTLIPAGTVFVPAAGAGNSYVSEADVTILAGDTTATILAAASAAGVSTNLPAATAMAMTPIPPDFVSAANPAAFSNGADVETDAQRLQRFQGFISTLARGTIAAIIYGAKTVKLFDVNGLVTEAVKAAAVIEPYVADHAQPVGLVHLFIHNGVGATSGALVTRTAAVVYGYTDASGNKVAGWKAAGANVVVAAATEVPVDMTAVLTALPGFDPVALVTAVTAALEAYALGLDLGVDFVFAEAVSLCMDIAGMANIVFTTPTADVTAADDEKIMPGVMTITHT